MTRPSANALGAIFMCASMAGFSANDAVMKLAGPDYGLSQAIFMRGALLCLFFGAFAWARGTFRHRPCAGDALIIAIRAVSEIGIAACFLTAVFNMPIANATAILQFVPLALAITAHFVLGETCGPRRMLAILAGLFGVLLIIRPGTDGFNSYSLLALGAVFFVILRDLSARRLSRNADSLFVTLVSAAVVTMSFGAATIAGPGWSPVAPGELGPFALAALFLFAGYYFSVVTMRTGDLFFVTPFRYSIMIFSAVFGFAAFGEIPDVWTALGILILACAGIFTIWREKLTIKP